MCPFLATQFLCGQLKVAWELCEHAPADYGPDDERNPWAQGPVLCHSLALEFYYPQDNRPCRSPHCRVCGPPAREPEGQLTAHSAARLQNRDFVWRFGNYIRHLTHLFPPSGDRDYRANAASAFLQVLGDLGLQDRLPRPEPPPRVVQDIQACQWWRACWPIGPMKIRTMVKMKVRLEMAVSTKPTGIAPS